MKKMLIFIFIFTSLLYFQSALAQSRIFCCRDPYVEGNPWKCWGEGYCCREFWSIVPCGGNKINFSGTLEYQMEKHFLLQS